MAADFSLRRLQWGEIWCTLSLNFYVKEALNLVNKKMSIIQILEMDRNTAAIMMNFGMHCLGCPSSRGETVEEACAVHGIDVDKLLELVNEEANKPIAE